MTDSCACVRTATVHVPGADLGVCRSGAGGRTLVCLPPGPGLGHQVARALHAVFAGMGAVAIVEYPGHGAGSPAGSRGELATRIARYVDGLADPVLVGHSWGADMALDVAALCAPAGLVLLSPPPSVHRPSTWTAGSRDLRTALRAGEAGGEWYRRYLAEYAIPLGFGGDRTPAARLLAGVPCYDEAWRALRRCGASGTLDERLTACAVPTLLVAGSGDALLDRRELAAIGALPHVRTSTVPGGHYVFVDAPGPVAAAVAGYLRDLRAVEEASR
jgi:pimeloyl-ACP methyl ester carboxylesterase